MITHCSGRWLNRHTVASNKCFLYTTPRGLTVMLRQSRYWCITAPSRFTQLSPSCRMIHSVSTSFLFFGYHYNKLLLSRAKHSTLADCSSHNRFWHSSIFQNTKPTSMSFSMLLYPELSKQFLLGIICTTCTELIWVTSGLLWCFLGSSKMMAGVQTHP